MKESPGFSVLMSVYVNEKPLFLGQSLNSIINQNNPPSEIVLVKDGPLTPQLDAVIENFEIQNKGVLSLVVLPTNQGLGIALQQGLLNCKYNLVARMDTDDIAKPERLKDQIEFMTSHQEVDIVGSNTLEFANTPTEAGRIRKVPEAHEEIVSMARFRNPMNHMSVMFRKDKVLQAGGYRNRLYFEDYDLWIRMIQKGFNFRNLQSSLIYVRTGNDLIGKRHGLRYAKLEYAFFAEHHKSGFFSTGFYLSTITIRFIMRLVPKSMLGFFYEKLLRKAVK